MMHVVTRIVNDVSYESLFVAGTLLGDVGG